MKTLRSYFESESQQRQALNSFFTAWGGNWPVWEVLDLYDASRGAFYSPLHQDERLRKFEIIDGQLAGYWQVFRPSSRSDCWPSRQIFETIQREFTDFQWGGSVSLLNFLRDGNRSKLLGALTAMRRIKPNQGYPIMTVSKFLHFYNPKLFPIYDEKVIWGQVFKRFGAEFQTFCFSTPGISCNNDYTALWYHNYICWASSLMSVAHENFMRTFLDWLGNEQGTALAMRKFDPTTLYAMAFEYTATGASVVESGGKVAASAAGSPCR